MAGLVLNHCIQDWSSSAIWSTNKHELELVCVCVRERDREREFYCDIAMGFNMVHPETADIPSFS